MQVNVIRMSGLRSSDVVLIIVVEILEATEMFRGNGDNGGSEPVGSRESSLVDRFPSSNAWRRRTLLYRKVLNVVLGVRGLRRSHCKGLGGSGRLTFDIEREGRL